MCCCPLFQVLAALVFILGAVFSGDLGAGIFDQSFGGGRVAAGGWTAFLAFVLVVLQALMIVLRFLNFAAAYQYPVIVLLVVSVCGGEGGREREKVVTWWLCMTKP